MSGKTIGFMALAVIGGLWGASSSRAAETDIGTPGVGHRHPDFVLPTIGDRRPVKLSDFRGNKVLLIEFASW